MISRLRHPLAPVLHGPLIRRVGSFLVGLAAGTATAAPVITGVVDKTRYANAVTFTVTGATSAALDGQPVAVGSPVTVNQPQFHQVTATDGQASVQVRFIVHRSERDRTEDGIPPMTPYRLVPDAPNAFASAALALTLPPAYPANLPLPLVGRLIKGPEFGATAGDPLWLNGTVTSTADFAASPMLLRRGWGSTILPAPSGPGVLTYGGSLQGLSAPATVTIEAATTWTTKSGTVTGADDWGENARIHLTGDLTLAAGARLTIGAGSVIRCAAGVDITIPPSAAVAINGVAGRPVVFTPGSVAQPWGGFWLQSATGTPRAELLGTHTVFCGWGADQTWLDTAPHDDFVNHRPQQPLAAIGKNASVSLTDCALVGPTVLNSLRGSAFATNDGSLSLTRTLIQRCITGGEQVKGSVEIHSCAFMEMTEPGVDVDGPAFVNADNDGLYLVPGSGRTYHLSKTVIGWCKDDGIDTGGNGGGATLVSDCWFENCTHEAISNSGANRQPESLRGVHFNSGQGMECGYGESGVGPQSLVDRSLLVGNMVGARYGDNYGGGSWTYGGTHTVRDSLLLYNQFHDAWAIEFTSWAYQNQRLIVQNTRLSRPEDLATQSGVEDSGNTLWNAETDGPLLAPFMPVAGSEVGVDLLVTQRQDTLAAMPAQFTARLSTFSSRLVTVPWQVIGKPDLEGSEQTVLADGQLTFRPGETVKFFAPVLPASHGAMLVAVTLGPPTAAAVMGPPALYLAPAALPSADAGLVLARVDDQWFLLWSDPARLPQTSTDLITWTPRPDLTSPVPVTTQESRRFWR